MGKSENYLFFGNYCSLLTGIRKLQYAYVSLSSSDILRASDEARLAETSKYGPCSYL